MNVTFSSKGKNHTATASDIFMDNGVRVVYIKDGKRAHPTAQRVELKPNEWERIRPQLTAIDYEAYYGRKPNISNINLYKVKE